MCVRTGQVMSKDDENDNLMKSSAEINIKGISVDIPSFQCSKSHR